MTLESSQSVSWIKMVFRSGFFAGLVRERLYLREGRGCVLLVLIALLVPVATMAQDVAEAARQDKARKAAQGERQSHVYTNEDLQKAEIVSRENSPAVEVRKKNSDGVGVSAATATSAAKPVVTAPTNDDREKVVVSESLGEVARKYRREKVVRQAERASANPPASQFHLEVTTPVLAEIAPRRVLSGPTAVPALPAARSVQPQNSGASVKRDPFLRPGLGIANRHEAINESKPVPSSVLIGRSAAMKIVAPNSSGAKAAVRPANNGADVVVGMTRAENVPAMMASRISIPSRPSASLVVTTGSDGMIVVRTGDSLWSLSRGYSGVGARWRGWLKTNPGIDEKRLRPGMRLIAPRGGNYVALQQKASASEGGRYKGASSPGVVHDRFRVRPGDSLWKIAAERYGDGRLWTCIARANAEWRDVEKIYPGQTLLVPAACGK